MGVLTLHLHSSKKCRKFMNVAFATADKKGRIGSKGTSQEGPMVSMEISPSQNPSKTLVRDFLNPYDTFHSGPEDSGQQHEEDPEGQPAPTQPAIDQLHHHHIKLFFMGRGLTLKVNGPRCLTRLHTRSPGMTAPTRPGSRWYARRATCWYPRPGNKQLPNDLDALCSLLPWREKGWG